MWYAGFALGFISGTHCVGMCGPLHLALAARQQGSRRFLLGRVSFNLGRVATYTMLGILAGGLGDLGRLALPQQQMAFLSGGLMLLLALKPLITKREVGGDLAARGTSKLKETLFRFMSRKSLTGQALTGAVNGLLPCGTVYLALAATLSMPSLASSLAFMAAFGLGTLPLLLPISIAGAPIQRLVRRVPQVQYLLPAFIGGLLIIRGLTFQANHPAACHEGSLLNTKTQHEITCSKR